MKQSIIAPSSILFLLMSASSSRAETVHDLDLCDFEPAFTENFDTMSIASRQLGGMRWIAHTPWNGDFGDAKFTDPGRDSAFAIKDGELRITANRNPAGRWQSGLIAAADSTGRGSGVRFGYFEARMRMPPGPGVWPAFWLASLKPAKDQSPGVEIDVVEYYGHADATYSSSVHAWYKGDEKSRSRHETHRTSVAPGSLVSGFHNYGVQVSPDEITFFLDRAPVWRQPTPPELQMPLYPLVNLALGSGFPIVDTPDPSTLEVKYVHLYAYDPDGRSRRCPK